MLDQGEVRREHSWLEVLAEGVKGCCGLFGDRDVLGRERAQNDLEQVGRIQQDIARRLVDEGAQYLQGHLDVARRRLVL